ncbi:MAG: DUF4160 domain-containing protein [Sedimentisphaerales bacterium]|nr:DUF4160 domain-containing protein [Sedimentisphaerales bacterium]
MSPTIFREGKYRFFFFSLEEDRIHVHITAPEGEAKFWLEPSVKLASHTGFNNRDLNLIQTIVEDRKDEIIRTWQSHFKP